MESFGDTLRKTRERLEIEIDKAARDTSILPEYIRALEDEQVSVFPGEPYLVGFLRNYSEYLGIDPKTMIALYKAKMIQEAPVPEGLLRDGKKKMSLPVIISLAALIVAGAAAFFYFAVFSKDDTPEQTAVITHEKGTVYTVNAQPLQKRVYISDILRIPSGDTFLEIQVHETLISAGFKTPQGIQYVDLGEERSLDVDGTGGPDIVVFVSDISKTDASSGAEVRIFLPGTGQTGSKAKSASQQALLAGSTDLKSSLDAKSSVDISGGTDENSLSAASAPLSQTSSGAGARRSVIFEGTRAYPFTVNVSFRGSSLFRYQSDANESAEEFFTNKDLLTIKANNGVRLWMTNAGSVKIQIIGDGKTYDFESGRAGQVYVADIKWVKDPDGKVRLAVLEVE